jgi:hypothetical protein
MDTTEHDGVTYTLTNELRFLERDGERRLQQLWEGPTIYTPPDTSKGYDGRTTTYNLWRDVPLVVIPKL